MRTNLQKKFKKQKKLKETKEQKFKRRYDASKKYSEWIIQNTPNQYSKNQYFRQIRMCGSKHEKIDYETGEVIKQTWYCRSRSCVNCNNIKIGKAMNDYSEKLERLKDKKLVTLTAETIPKKYLDIRLENMQETWKRIKDVAKAKKMSFNGIRKLEINHSKAANGNHMYHPHYHILIEGQKQAEYIVKQWIKIMKKLDPKIKISEKAQDIQKATKGMEKELFKYALKPIKYVETDEEGNRVSINRLGKKILISAKQEYVRELYLTGKRTFQPFGNVLTRNIKKLK